MHIQREKSSKGSLKQKQTKKKYILAMYVFFGYSVSQVQNVRTLAQKSRIIERATDISNSRDVLQRKSRVKKNEHLPRCAQEKAAEHTQLNLPSSLM